MARALDSSLVMENMEAAALAAKGIPWGEAEWLARQIGVTLVEFAALIGVSQPTLFRRRKERRFTAAESEHIVRFARVWCLALEVFESEEGARTWLKTPAIYLKGRQPLDVARSELGVREVEDLLRRIDFGIAL